MCQNIIITAVNILLLLVHSKVKVRCTAAKVKDSIVALLVPFRSKAIFIKCRNGVCRRLGGNLTNPKILHPHFIREQRHREGFPQPLADTISHAFPYAVLVGHGKGHDVVEKNLAAPHVIDVPPQIVRIDLQRIHVIFIQLHKRRQLPDFSLFILQLEPLSARAAPLLQPIEECIVLVTAGILEILKGVV